MMTSMDSNGISRLPVDGAFGKLHSSHSFSSISSLNHLRLGQHGQAGDVISRSYRSHAAPLPPPRYSSLPMLQPPLLPLPPPSMSKHGKKMSNAMHTRDQRKRRRPTASSKREPPGSSTSVATRVDDVSQSNNAAKNKQEEIIVEEEEEEAEEEKAVISPPPSSLPLPSLALIRLRTAVVSRGDSNGGTGCGGAMLQAGGATDELRRLLRL